MDPAEHDAALRRLRLALAAADAAGIGFSLSRPPIWRLLWFCGWIVPPPHFARAQTVLLVVFLTNLIVWGLPAIILAAIGGGHPKHAAAMSVAGSAGFALLALVYFRWSAARNRLPAWAVLG